MIQSCVAHLLGSHMLLIMADDLLPQSFSKTLRQRAQHQLYCSSEYPQLSLAAGCLGQPDDIAQAALFLADPDKSGFITGQTLVVDGGVTCKLASIP